MQATFEHARAEDLERYSMGTLLGPEGEALEEHLLLCPACQDDLTETDIYVQTMRAAASRLRAEALVSHLRNRSGFWDFFWRPGLAYGIIAAVCLTLVVWVSVSRQPATSAGVPPAAVLLQTIRGPGGAVDAKAPVG
ncbi:MAG TPA: hypothetical protein VN203_11780, partial [Candidatus Acidoferrum sp.]|nr:hypothetical protein [Candidatus Acidoferrum sp.]